ncbi:MAG TPA: hypothetical protein VK638_31270, partial [Edaphobacter sp.]|nr:hypothetical protein [Edaphobacter sp.]
METLSSLPAADRALAALWPKRCTNAATKRNRHVGRLTNMGDDASGTSSVVPDVAGDLREGS